MSAVDGPDSRDRYSQMLSDTVRYKSDTVGHRQLHSDSVAVSSIWSLTPLAVIQSGSTSE